MPLRFTNTSVRRPRIVLVDELAHTNVPGSRHERRFQDVEELLGARGLNVALGTFHATCARMLRTDPAPIRRTRDFTILDQDDRRRLLEHEPRAAETAGGRIAEGEHPQVEAGRRADLDLAWPIGRRPVLS